MKLLKQLLFSALLSLGVVADAYGAFNFSHQTSGVKLTSGSQLIVLTPLTGWNGTLEIANNPNNVTSALVSGQTISLSNGVLISGFSQSQLTGVFDPAGDSGRDTILLQGNGRLLAEPGTLLHKILVRGRNNIIEGQLDFKVSTNSSLPIQLQVSLDPRTTLTMNVHNSVTTSIALNGGELILGSDLTFQDKAQITPSGTVQLNGNKITFGQGGSDIHFSNTVTFNSGKIDLDAKTGLSGYWTIKKDTYLNGNANVFDLAMGGTIQINADTKLYMNNLKLSGLGAHRAGRAGGWIIFEHRETSTLVFQDVLVELDGTYVFTSGHVFSCGPTTVGTKEFTLKFLPPTGARTNKRFSADGVTVWKDSLCKPIGSAGTINVGAADIYFDSINCGTIKNLASWYDATIIATSHASGTTTGTACDEVHIYPGQFIKTCNLAATWCGATSKSVISKIRTIAASKFGWDGRGRQIAFANTVNPQLIICTDQSLTVSNIDLTRVNFGTFHFDSGSRLITDTAVKFEFHENVSFTQDVLLMTGTGNKLIWNGSSCEKKVTLAKGTNDQVLKLQSNTLEIANMIVDGLEHITTFSSWSSTQQKVITGSVRVLCDGTAIANEAVRRDLHFEVIGPNATLSLPNSGGVIILDDGNLINFDIRASLSLDLTVSHGSHVVLGNKSMELKAIDALRIEGTGNVIEVANTFTLNAPITFGKNAQLTFKFDEDCAPDPVVYIAKNITLGPNTRLVFEGNGTVKLKDGISIIFNGTNNKNRPELNVADAAVMTLDKRPEGKPRAQALFSGFGRVCVDWGGELRIGELQHLTIGNATTDDFVILVHRDGTINVSGRGSFMSLRLATFDIDFEQGGQLTILNHAEFEINSYLQSAQPGLVKRIVFDANGKLNIDTDGTLNIGANRNNATFVWDNQGGQIGGNGLVELVGEQQFSARFLPVQFVDNTATAFTVVQSLVQLVPQLVYGATVFLDSSRQRVLRTKSGNFRTLAPDVIITGDRSDGIVYGLKGNKPITINDDGRVVS